MTECQHDKRSVIRNRLKILAEHPERIEAQEPHECPYQVEVNDDHEFKCTCCAACEQECSDDI